MAASRSPRRSGCCCVRNSANAVIYDEAGLSERFSRIDGNFRNVEIEPECFDLAVLSHILHLESMNGVKAILRKVYAALRSGGHVVIADWIVVDGRVGPPSALMFNFTMLLISSDGKSHEQTEVVSALEGEGYRDTRTLRIDGQTTLIFARKP